MLCLRAKSSNGCCPISTWYSTWITESGAPSSSTTLRNRGRGKLATPMVRARPCALNVTRVSMVLARSQSRAGQ
ncbi:hypothetical protein D3C76_1414740 [compost metagenome]